MLFLPDSIRPSDFRHHLYTGFQLPESLADPSAKVQTQETTAQMWVSDLSTTQWQEPCLTSRKSGVPSLTLTKEKLGCINNLTFNPPAGESLLSSLVPARFHAH